MAFTQKSRQEFIEKLKKAGIAYRHGWQNFMEGIDESSVITVEVNSRKQSQKVVQIINDINQIHSHQLSLRAAAGWADKERSCGCLFWKSAQEKKYNESYSFTPGAVGDVIMRFGKKFHEVEYLGKIEGAEKDSSDPIKKLQQHEVRVTAGTQMAKFEQSLKKHHKSLTTTSMISYVSPVGLAANAGHGTGKNEPSFAGLITELEILCADGQIRHLKKGDEGFDDIVGAHLGMAGIVLSMKLRVVDQFKLEEKARNFTSVEKLNKKLPQLLDSQYFTLMMVPLYGCKPIEDEVVPNIQVRTWDYTNKGKAKSKAPYEPTVESFTQELTVKIGAQVQRLLLDKLRDLIPAYMLMAASFVTLTRGEKAKIDLANHIAHYQVTFPKGLRDLSFLIPVKDDNAAELLNDVLTKIDNLLTDAPKSDEYPVTYAVYVRYFEGTNGGVSTSSHEKGERVFAIEVVSNPLAPGFDKLGQDLIDYFDEKGIVHRYHLGKENPNQLPFADFVGQQSVDDFKQALANFYGSEKKLNESIFATPYMKQYLDMPLTAKEEKLLKAKHPVPPSALDDDECIIELSHLIESLDKLNPQSIEQQHAVASFKEACQNDLDKIKTATQLSHQSSIAV
jgi:hypothetical protein